jgi:hypothetical protein
MRLNRLLAVSQLVNGEETPWPALPVSVIGSAVLQFNHFFSRRAFHGNADLMSAHRANLAVKRPINDQQECDKHPPSG